ncbi:MAG: uncharacterized protein KVP18_000135 [Porospora cf. gigantea A]|uniref:uncharacterized protein n=2 Tax=Porospora cf. gigantea A TaxID=2853593 RepID=UPI003559A0AA|nr:MAG: hypothetical protein KVP18_000135 [Porospora cf. gigantea A]
MPPSTDAKIDTEPTKEKHDGRYQQILDEGVVGQELEIDSHKTKRKKTQSDRNLIMSGLRGNLVCSTLKEPEILALCDAMEYFVFILGDVVCQQGSLGSYFFIIDSGKFEVSINGKAINCMKKGKAFGEIALIHNTPRSATVKALTKGGVWGVQRTTFRNILKQLSSKNFAENRQFLESIRLFEMLTDSQKSMITNALVLETFKANVNIITEGEAGDQLYIIKEGETRVSIDGKLVRELKKGDYFGERALLYDEPRSASITSIGHVSCLCIGRDLLRTVLGSLQHVLFRNMEVIALQNSPVFSQFTSDQMDSLLKATVIKDFPENYTIVDRELRGRGVRCFIVLEGSVLVSLEGRLVGRRERGMPFGGEYVLSPHKPFMHRVDSISACKLALLTQGALAACLGSSDVDETFEFNRKIQLIRKMYIFRYLSQMQIYSFVKAFKEASYRKDDVIITEGEVGSRFFIIRGGEVIVLKNGQKLRTMGKNDYFGERALLYDEPRTATIVAVAASTDLWVVDKEVFLSIMRGPMLSHLEERIRLQDTRIVFSDLDTVRVAGRGTFGTVKLVRHRPTGSRYALKCVKKEMVIKLRQQNQISRERELMSENDHPFIVRLVRTFKDEKFIYFLTELATGGELYDAMRVLEILDRPKAQFYTGSILLAIEYLHERNIAFRDLKPENVLLDCQGFIKLIDFGCAKKIYDRSYTLVGTPQYMAPEVVLGKGYTQAADIWSLGIMMYEFLCGPLPFDSSDDDDMGIFKSILTAKITFPSFVQDEAGVQLIKGLLCRLPEFRMGCSLGGAKDIKSHAFFSGFDWDALLGRQLEPPLVPVQEVYADDQENYQSESEHEEDESIEAVEGDEPIDENWVDAF